MQEQKMNQRVKSILRELCRQEGYVTLGAIAATLGVSAKTVLRDLSAVEEWLAEQGWQLQKKTGTGVALAGDAKTRREVLQAMAGQQSVEVYSPQERQKRIISELLQRREPVKLYTLALDLKVTEGTVSHDLDKAEQWLKGQGVLLIRKPGLGVYVDGAEEKLRRAMVNFLYETVGADQLLEVIRSNLGKTERLPSGWAQSRLLNLIDQDVIGQLEETIRETEEAMGGRLADTAYVGLTVHLALAVQRIRQQEKISMAAELLEELKRYREYAIARRLADAIAARFAIAIPEDEIGYITMHLKGLKNRDGGAGIAQPSIGNFELVKVAKEIIRAAEGVSGQFLAQNEKLLVGLVNHLGPAVSRLRMNLEIRNPLLAEIKAFYPELIEVSRQCVEPVERQWNVVMPEAEIAYIAMHLGAALEDSRRRSRIVYRVAIACPTGMGTSRLLASKIEKEYDNIIIVDVISSLRLEEGWLKEKKIDFILATIPISDCSLPVVVVNPLLFAADKKRIAELLQRLKGQTQTETRVQTSTISLQEKIITLGSYQSAILELLEHFFLLGMETATVDGIIDAAVRLCAKGESVQSQLALDLKEREAKGGTIIAGHGFILLHCRTSAVEELFFGAVALKEPLAGIHGRAAVSEEIRLAVIMLAPLQCHKNAMETISYLSQMLIERPAFLAELRRGDQAAARLEISRLLEKLYKGKSKMVLEA